jgi:hypothetical protein
MIVAFVGSIFERVKFSSTSHDDGEGAKRVVYLHRTGVVRENVGQATVSHRAFIEVGTYQHDAALL